MVAHSISGRILGGKCRACGRPRVAHGAPTPDDPLGCLRRPPVQQAAATATERLPPEGEAIGSRKSRESRRENLRFPLQ
jgi:hypothetical protein